MLKNGYFIFTSTFLVIFLFCNPQNLSSQEQPPPTPQQVQDTQTDLLNCDKVNEKLGLKRNNTLSIWLGGAGLSNTFTQLTDLKDQITAEKAKFEEQVTTLNQQYTFAPTKVQRDKIIEGRKKPQAKNQQNDTDSDIFNDFITEDTPTKEEIKLDIDKARNSLDDTVKKTQCLREAVASIYSPEQSFKYSMSAIFAALIGLVILGFFILSLKDETIRRAIFSGQTGIQFLTLFSIVIAIILFGITNILHDKELAALLGGLSGYILGRYNSDNGTPPTNPEPR